MTGETTADKPRRGARSIRQYASGARLALWIQLGVAFLALAGVGVFILIAQQKSDQVTDLNRQLTDLNSQISAGQGNLRLVSNTTDAIAKATTMLAADPLDGPTSAINVLSNADAALLASVNEPSVVPGDVAQLRSVLAVVLASAYSAQGDFSNAIEFQKQAIKLDDSSPGAMAKLASYHCKNDDNEAALKLAATLKAEFPEAYGDPFLRTSCRGILDFPVVDGDFDRAKADQSYVASNLLIMIGSEADRANAIAIARTLCGVDPTVAGSMPLDGSGPYSSPGIEVTRSQSTQANGKGVIKYYYAAQAEEAAYIARRIATASSGLGLESWSPEIGQVQVPSDEQLPRHQLEIWFPPGNFPVSTAPGANAPGDKRFACRSPDWVTNAVRDLNDPAALARASAVEVALTGVRKSGAEASKLLDLLLKQLEDDAQLRALSAAARVNVLTVLNDIEDWPSRAERPRLASALLKLEQLANDPSWKIGPQARQLIGQLKRNARLP